jgi:quercetin dioxygenase-like cupin family protein
MEFNVMKLIIAFIVWVLCLSVEIAPRGAIVAPQPAVLHKNDGELRMRRPREGVASPSTEFLLKIGPKTNGSKHLLVFSEEMPPGAAIPRHRHHGEEEIILIQSGRAHLWLGEQEYDAESGALVFIPPDTWVSLENTGTDSLGLVAVWNEPGFEDMLRCGSVRAGERAELLSRDGVKNCYHHGDAELR